MTVFVALLAASGTAAALVAGLDIGLVPACASTRHVVGDHIVTSWFGRQRPTSLRDVVRVGRYSYRGAVGLYLYPRVGRRVNVPVRSPGSRLDMATAGHLLRWLDRPGVAWEPGARELLALGVGATGIRFAQPLRQPLPPGRVSAWSKALLGLSVAAVGFALVALPVVSGLAWRDYEQSARIQAGPTVLAIVEREWVTAYSGKSGTHHVTHFRVHFNPLSCYPTGAANGGGPYCRYAPPIETVATARGVYAGLPAGSHLDVRYDPAAPTHAELAGRPMSTRQAAVDITAVSAVTVIFLALTWPATRRSRRRRARLHARLSAAAQLRAP